MADRTSRKLLERIEAGDDLAATELLDRYTDRLIALARSRLSKKLARRIDPEDVVQSACRSFFRNAREGLYDVRDGDDLWRMLAAITVHKAVSQVRRHTAAKRAIGAEESSGIGGIMQFISPEALARDPSPDDAARLVEETQLMMACLSPLHRKILQLCLEGHDVDEVAEQAGCSERTVERAMKISRTRLEQKLFRDIGP